MRNILAALLAAIVLSVPNLARAAGEDHIEITFTGTRAWTNTVPWSFNVGSVAITIPSKPLTNVASAWIVNGTTSNKIMHVATSNGFETAYWLNDGGIVRVVGTPAGGKIVARCSSSASARLTIDLKKE